MKRDLTVCRSCRRDFVQPITWEERGALMWDLRLRCGNCGAKEHGTFDQATVDIFDLKLDLLAEEMIRGWLDYEKRNMAEEAERFAAALALDAILPEDF